MKIEIEKDFPQYFKPAYPEEFQLFSHFEVMAGGFTVITAKIIYAPVINEAFLTMKCTLKEIQDLSGARPYYRRAKSVGDSNGHNKYNDYADVALIIVSVA